MAFDPEEIMELERIIMDRGGDATFVFLRNGVYAKIMASQKSRKHGRDINPAKPTDHLKNT